MYEVWTAEQYRSADYDALLSQRDALANAVSAGVADAAEYRAQVELCKAEFANRNDAAELRALDIQRVAGGEGSFVARSGQVDEVEDVDDIFDTAEYRKAFMDFICRKAPMPEKFRSGEYAERTADAFTTTDDIPVMIPTTLMTQIIEKLDEVGEIWSRVNKTNIPGGVEYPILDLMPVAYWVGEEEVSEYQALMADEKVSFSYYEIECRIGQTWLASITSFDAFQRRFVPAAAKAIIKKLESSVIKGSGSGQALGIVNDPRVENTVTMDATQMADWTQWHKRVKRAIPKAYRKGSFIMAQSTWDAYIETFADDNNAPVSIGYNPVTGEEEYRFMGRPCLTVEDDVLPFYDDAEDDEVFAIYCRLEDYSVNSNLQMATYQWRDPDTRKDKTLAYMVADGKVLDPYGIVLIAKDAGSGGL